MTCLLSGTFNNFYDIDRTRQIISKIRESVDLRIIWARADEAPSDTLGVGETIVISAAHSEMPKLVSESHFGIAICKQDNLESLAAAVPTKIGEFLASGRPVIVSSGVGDLDRLLTTTRVGVVIDHSDSLATVAEQIEQLVKDQSTPERCRELAMQHFDMEKSIARYLNIYERMQH